MLFDLFPKMLSESCVTEYRLSSDKEFPNRWNLAAEEESGPAR
jgi:hypothetical protein